MSKEAEKTTACCRRVTAFKGHLTRAFNQCEAESQKTPVNNISLQFSINKVNTAWSNYESAFHECELITNLSDEV